jgi:UDP-3-O-[3-hydroxymyristoyl] glucosamine N-acyltransferase
MGFTLEEVARQVGGTVVGDGSVVVSGVAGIREAEPGQLTFLSNPKYERYLPMTRASAIIVSGDYAGRQDLNGKPLIVAENPYGAFARAMEMLGDPADAVEKGIHPSAVIAESATIGEGVSIGPQVVIGKEAVIGDGTVVYPGVYIGAGVQVGRDTIIRPNVTLKAASRIGDRVIVHSGSVIGSDGFGFAREGDCHRKVPQIGTVIVGDDVEIGANVCIDRATVGATRIGNGTKIDNLVQIAHNVVVGEGSIVVAQVGISGSTEVGRGVVLGGQAGLVGHITIGDGAMVAAQAGVTRSIDARERVSGYPAQKHSVAKRLLACLQRLPDLFRRVKDVEARLDRLEEDD